MANLKTITFWYFDKKYYKAISGEKKQQISKTEFYTSTKDMAPTVSTLTAITTFTKFIR